MRQIVLDTETTGLEPSQGHRIIEIGCVEISNRRITHNRFHQYIKPEREIDEGAIEVHGITNEFLDDKPLFRDVAGDFLAFVEGAELIIHNAPFDVGFINHELKLSGASLKRIEDSCSILDTLSMARQMHPGQKNNLDALCKRYEIDNSSRSLHGALLDAEILADVYLAMTGGQVHLSLDGVDENKHTGQVVDIAPKLVERNQPLRIISASESELSEHNRRMADIAKTCGDKPVWLLLEEADELPVN